MCVRLMKLCSSEVAAVRDHCDGHWLLLCRAVCVLIHFIDSRLLGSLMSVVMCVMSSNALCSRIILL